MNTEVTNKEFTQTVEIGVKEYAMIQVALWTLHKKVKDEMHKTHNQQDVNELYVYAQEIIELKHDLKDAFDIKSNLTF